MKVKILITAAILGLLFGFMHPAFSANGTSYIEAVKVTQAQEALSVSVVCSKSVDYKVINMNDPYKCLILEISPAQLTRQAMITAEVNRGFIKGVRVGQFSDKPEIVRIVVDLNESTQYQVHTNRGGAVISLDINYDKSPHIAQVSLSSQKANILDKINKITFLNDETGAKKIAKNNTPATPVSVTPVSVTPVSVTPAPTTVTVKPAQTPAQGASTPAVSTAVKPATPVSVTPVSVTPVSVTPVSVTPAPVKPAQEQSKNTVKETVQKSVKPEGDLQPTALKKGIEINKDLPILKTIDTGVIDTGVTGTGVTGTNISGAPKELESAPVRGGGQTVALNNKPSNTSTSSVLTPSVLTPNASTPKTGTKNYIAGAGTPGAGTPLPEKQTNQIKEVKNQSESILPNIAYATKKQKTAKKTETPQVKEPTLNVDYENEDIVWILKDLAKRANKNIVTDSSVAGTITVSLKNVTLDRALQIILKTSGLAYKKVDNIIIVAKPENLNKISKVSIESGFGSDKIEVIPIVYAQADAIKKTLQNMIPDLDITIDKRLNALVISSSEGIIKQVKQTVEQLDQLPSISSDPNTVTKVIKVKYGTAKDILPMITKWYPQMRLIVDDRLNGFIVKEGKENLEKIEKLIATLDTPKRQVQFDVKIIDITESGAKTLGVSWNANSTAIMSTTLTEVSAATGVPPATGFFELPLNNPFRRTPISIPMVINYLISKGDAKILASPKILTLSGEKANISIGQNYPFVFTPPQSATPQALYIEVAVKLDITPQITPDGYIMAEVSPEISDMGTQTLTSCQTTKRSLKTNFIVKNGDTVILGGLYRKDFNSAKNKRPLFGDIPGIGEFFKNTTDTSSKDELIIMITAKIIEPGN